jgi:hypothetical protein
MNNNGIPVDVISFDVDDSGRGALGQRLEPDQAVIECRHPAAFTDWRPAPPRGLLVDL